MPGMRQGKGLTVSELFQVCLAARTNSLSTLVLSSFFFPLILGLEMREQLLFVFRDNEEFLSGGNADSLK